MKNEQATAALFAMISEVSPALASYTQERVTDELWSRPDLSKRDRSLVTVSALVARNATLAYPHYFNKALDTGLTATEISELLTHLGFYASLANAFGAIAVVREVFVQRGISSDMIPAIESTLLPINDVIPEHMQESVFNADAMKTVSSGLHYFTSEILRDSVWRRIDLAPRDRVLSTMATLAALGQAEQMPAFIRLAMHHGITKSEIGEVFAHIAFYCGWAVAQRAVVASEDVLK